MEKLEFTMNQAKDRWPNEQFLSETSKKMMEKLWKTKLIPYEPIKTTHWKMFQPESRTVSEKCKLHRIHGHMHVRPSNL